MALAGTALPDFLATSSALARTFFAVDNSAFFFCSMVRIFFRGFVLTTALLTFLLGARRTFLISSDFRSLLRSVLAILGWGRFQPFLEELGLRQVPKSPSNFECSFSPNTESAHMATRSQLQKIESVHLDAIDSGDVTECLGHALILVINNERSQLLNSPPVSELALASPHPASGVHLGNVRPGVGLSQEDDGVLGLGVALDLVGHDHRDLGDLADLVALGHDEGWDTGGRDGRAHGVTLLGNVHFPVPPSPGLSRSEHPPAAAHVTEGSLSRTVSTTAPDTGDPGHSTTSAP